MSTIRYRRLFLVVALLGLLSLGSAGCSGPSGDRVDIKQLREVSLTPADREYLVQVARAELLRTEPPKDTAGHPGLNDNAIHGAFVSVPRTGRRAATGFEFQRGLAEAVRGAARKAAIAGALKPGDVKQIRIDVITQGGKARKVKLGSKWRGDVTLSAVVFNTRPAVAFLGQEFKDYAVIRGKKKFSLNEFKSLLNARDLPKELKNQFRKDAVMEYVTTPIDSFLAETDGRISMLYRGNRLEGYEPTPERLLTAISDAGDYLTRAVGPSGKFDYNYDPARDKSASSYNLLRHAGTAFAMSQIYEITKNQQTLDAVKRALGFLESVSMGPNAEDARTADWKAVTQSNIMEAKLGGSGLALLAFGNYTRVTGDKQYIPLMQAYARFIAYMQKPDGDMVQRYYHRVEDRTKPYKAVLYYPGEAFFGLMTLYELDKDRRWLEVAAKGIDYIADVRDAQTPTDKLEHDHWLLYAINAVDKYLPADNRTHHAERVLEAMFNKFLDSSDHPDFVGGYYKNPKTTPTACRIEAKGAQWAMAVRHGNQDQARKILNSLKLGASFLMRNQYTDVNTMFFADPKRAYGGYQLGYWDPEIQIDFVQHSTSALIGLYHIETKTQTIIETNPTGGTDAPPAALPDAA